MCDLNAPVTDLLKLAHTLEIELKGTTNKADICDRINAKLERVQLPEEQEALVEFLPVQQEQWYAEEMKYAGPEDDLGPLCANTACVGATSGTSNVRLDTDYCEKGWFYKCEMKTAWLATFSQTVEELVSANELVVEGGKLTDIRVRDVLHDLVRSNYYGLSKDMNDVMEAAVDADIGYASHLALLYFVIRFQKELRSYVPKDLIMEFLREKKPMFVKIPELVVIGSNPTMWPRTRTDTLKAFAVRAGGVAAIAGLAYVGLFPAMGALTALEASYGVSAGMSSAYSMFSSVFSSAMMAKYVYAEARNAYVKATEY